MWAINVEYHGSWENFFKPDLYFLCFSFLSKVSYQNMVNLQENRAGEGKPCGCVCLLFPPPNKLKENSLLKPVEPSAQLLEFHLVLGVLFSSSPLLRCVSGLLSILGSMSVMTSVSVLTRVSTGRFRERLRSWANLFISLSSNFLSYKTMTWD